jgi:membrane-associated phospholipid phosphatase
MQNKLLNMINLLVAYASYLFLDLPFAIYLHSIRDKWISAVFEAITTFGKSELYLIPSAVLFIIYRKRKKAIAQKALYLFVVVAVSGILVDIIKVIAGRFRPVLYFGKGMYGFDFFHFNSDYLSFPSGHSATSFSLIIALSLLFPRFRYPLFIFGMIVAASRMVITAHYLSDVLIGAQIGWVTSVIFYTICFKQHIKNYY